MAVADEHNEHQGKLVYVVDDQEIFAEVVAAILRSEDYDTRTFQSGEEVMERLRSSKDRPVVLLTDYVMPGMSGMELIIKARTMVDGLKTVLFSGQVKDDIVTKYGVKPDRFLGKPFQPALLLDTLSEMSAA